MSLDLRTVIKELRNVEAEIARLERVAESYRTIISYKSGEASLDQAPEPDSLTDKPSLIIESRSPSSRRSTGEIKRPEFRDIQQKDAVKQILGSEPGRKFRTDELISLIYEAKTPGEFKTAKSSLGSALSRGIKNGDWKGASGQYYLEEDQNDLFQRQSA